MNRLWHFLLLVLTALALTTYGCGDDSDDMDDDSDEHADTDAAVEEGDELELPDVDCDQDVPAFDDVAAFAVCTKCHSSELTGDDRMDAEEDVNFDSYDDAKEEAEEAAHEVFEGDMPPKDSNLSLTAAEKEELYLWALCGTPE